MATTLVPAETPVEMPVKKPAPPQANFFTTAVAATVRKELKEVTT